MPLQNLKKNILLNAFLLSLSTLTPPQFFGTMGFECLFFSKSVTMSWYSARLFIVRSDLYFLVFDISF